MAVRIWSGSLSCLVAILLVVGAEYAAAEDVPWLASAQLRPGKVPSTATQVDSLLHPSVGPAIGTQDQWRARRPAIAYWWQEFLRLPQPQDPRLRAAPQLQLLQEERLEGVIRQRVSYTTPDGWETEAYLLRPEQAAGRRPGVVVFHSTVDHSIHQPAGVKGVPEKAFGLQLARRGFVTLCPRNFLWPTNDRIDAQGQTDKYLQRSNGAKGMAKMVYDAMIAVDILAARDDVDPQRLGAVGHSLGAKEVLYLAALDSRIQVAVSSEGGVGTRYSNWDASWYLGDEIRQPSFNHEHHELLSLVAPRPFLLIGGDSADGDQSWPFIEAALPVYRLYGDPARLALLNHRQGHSVPPQAEQAIYEWLETYLRVRGS